MLGARDLTSREGIDKRDKTRGPSDWAAFRHIAQEMLDDILGYLENSRARPAWQAIPKESRK